MKGFLKFIGVLAVIVIILYLVYEFGLPVALREVVDYNITMITDKGAKAKIQSIQNAKPDSYDYTYKQIFESSAKNSRWEYISGAGVTNDRVIFKGDEVTIIIEGADVGDGVYTKKPLVVEYDLMANGSFNMKLTIDGKEIQQDKKIYVIDYLANKVK